MKWQIVVTSLVLGLAVSTQSYGFDLLDRMLGVGGGGCCDPHPSCCTQKAAGCCAQKAPTCCTQKAPTCCTQKAPTCEAKCGVDPGCGHDHGCCKQRCCKRRCCKRRCCKPCAKPCYKPCCKTRCCRRPSLLGRLFCCDSGCEKNCCEKKCGHDHGCCEKKCAADPGCTAAPTCGCGAGQPAKAGGKPNPPAPIVDPSAFVPGQRRVVQVSTSVIR